MIQDRQDIVNKKIVLLKGFTKSILNVSLNLESEYADTSRFPSFARENITSIIQSVRSIQSVLERLKDNMQSEVKT